VCAPFAPISDSAERSSLRELIPSLPNTLPRCHSTVRGLRKSWAPISGFVCPPAATRATCASCGVSSSSVWAVRLRTVSPVARSSRRARSANASATGGTFTGPELNGELLPGASADWQLVLPDGTALGDIRYTLQTDAGELLYVQSRGVRHGSAEVLTRLARGEDVDASEYTFRTSTQIETAAPRLDWLNKGIFISVGGRQAAGVIYETYLVA
jgi:hypothetical protein